MMRYLGEEVGQLRLLNEARLALRSQCTRRQRLSLYDEVYLSEEVRQLGLLNEPGLAL